MLTSTQEKISPPELQSFVFTIFPNNRKDETTPVL